MNLPDKGGEPVFALGWCTTIVGGNEDGGSLKRFHDFAYPIGEIVLLYYSCSLETNPNQARKVVLTDWEDIAMD